MRLLDRYIRTNILTATVLVLLIVVGIESFMEFVQQLNTIGVGHFTVWLALLYVPMKLPSDCYQLFPMIGFLGSLIGLGRIASTSELMVMRSAGVSIHRIAWSVIKTAILMIVVVTLVGEVVAPALQFKADQMKTQAMGQSLSRNYLTSGIWLHQENDFIHIGSVVSPSKVSDVLMYQFNRGLHLRDVIKAKTAVLDGRGQWVLHDIQETDFNSKRAVGQKLSSEPVHFLFNPRYAHQITKGASEQSVVGLLKSILYREKTGLVTSQYWFAFWQRVIQPLTTIVMICLGIPFIFGSLRSASAGSRLLTGIVVGFAFYMLNQFFGPITMVYQFPPFLAALAPTVFFLCVYLLMLRKV